MYLRGGILSILKSICISCIYNSLKVELNK